MDFFLIESCILVSNFVVFFSFKKGISWRFSVSVFVGFCQHFFFFNCDKVHGNVSVLKM